MKALRIYFISFVKLLSSHLTKGKILQHTNATVPRMVVEHGLQSEIITEPGLN